MPDRALKSSEGYPTAFTTEHAVLCSVLAEIGTHEAVEALEKFALSRQADAEPPVAPYPVGWVAALAIAQRDPWDTVDEWLVGLVERDTPLVAATDSAGPELGVTAAAMLLHGTTSLFAHWA